jgi:hypothetical protein
VPRELDPVFAEPPVDLGGVMVAAMRLLGSSWLHRLLAGEESRISADYRNACIAQVGSKQIRSMSRRVAPSREKVLCITIVVTDILCAHQAEPGSLCFR